MIVPRTLARGLSCVNGISNRLVFQEGFDLKKPKINHKYKWYFAIGTTSRVPGSKKHYLIMDFDNPDSIFSLGEDLYGASKAVIQKTPHGWHIYTNRICSWKELLSILRNQFLVDQKWIDIGEERGYLFLADKDRMHMEWPVERMIIWAKREKGITPRQNLTAFSKEVKLMRTVTDNSGKIGGMLHLVKGGKSRSNLSLTMNKAKR